MKKERKGKIQSINFKEETYKILSDLVKKKNSNYSAIINEMILYVLGSPKEIKQELAKFCIERANELEEYKEKVWDERYFYDLFERSSKVYRTLHEFFDS